MKVFSSRSQFVVLVFKGQSLLKGVRQAMQLFESVSLDQDARKLSTWESQHGLIGSIAKDVDLETSHCVSFG